MFKRLQKIQLRIQDDAQLMYQGLFPCGELLEFPFQLGKIEMCLGDDACRFLFGIA
jgi:hypothetical protein